MPKCLPAALLSTCLISGTAAAACDLNDMTWQRSSDPVFRDLIPAENYEAASDPHVFTAAGRTLMVYSGDDSGEIATKLAEQVDGVWQPGPTLLGSSTGHDLPAMKETPFYFRTASGQHQIYFIGYNNRDIYDSEVYRATADALEGPWTIDPDPVIPRGTLAGKEVEVITSPSVVAHDGRLWMAFLGWDGFEDVTEVWVLGAVSDDDGATWTDLREVPVPIGMEGQLTPAPDGGFVAAYTGLAPDDEGEAIYLACADHPFGPYDGADAPALIQAGAPWEVDEIIAPQVAFGADGSPVLYYTGADYATGWWVMQADPQK